MAERTDRWTQLSEVCYRILRSRATDCTETTKGRSALVIAPHPDDETFGCGATILRKRSLGTEVSICVVSDGGAYPAKQLSHEELVKLREDNFREACRIYGIEERNLIFLRMPDAELSSRTQVMTDAFAKIMLELSPDEIYIPSSIDWHPDHLAVHEAAVQAANKIAMLPRVRSYLISPWLRSAWTSPSANPLMARLALSRIFFVACAGLHPQKVRTEQYLETKRRLMDVYAFELEFDYEFFERWSLRSEELFFEVHANRVGRT